MTRLDVQVPRLEFVELGGYRMAYRQWGDTARSDALVLVHGITSSSLSWVRVAPRLAQETRVIAVDLKGHGDSDRPVSGYRLTDQAKEVAGLVRELGLSSVQLLGHSWGGGICLELGARSDLPLSRLILEDPAISTSGGTPQQREQVVDNYIASVGLTREAAEARVRANVAPGWTEEDVLGKIDATVKTSPASVQAVFAENGAWNVADRLTLVRVPTLMVRAEVANGGIVPEHVLATAAGNPSIRVVTVPGADHNIHRGQFDAFMAAIAPFLAS
jgi:pimeloyl-ACP methyl ester carboxylesterase